MEQNLYGSWPDSNSQAIQGLPSDQTLHIPQLQSRTYVPQRQVHHTEYIPPRRSAGFRTANYTPRDPPPPQSNKENHMRPGALHFTPYLDNLLTIEALSNLGERMGLGDWKMESYRSLSLINLDIMAVNKEWLRSYLAGRRSFCLARELVR